MAHEFLNHLEMAPATTTTIPVRDNYQRVHIVASPNHLSPSGKPHSNIDADDIDVEKDLNSAASWSPAEVFGKEVFLPNGTSYAIEERQDIPLPVPVLESCASLDDSVLMALDVDHLQPAAMTKTTTDPWAALYGQQQPFVQGSLPKPPSLRRTTPFDIDMIDYPAKNDVCCGLISHPGTKKWRSIVDGYAVQSGVEWSERLFQEIKGLLNGCKFWVCLDSDSKARKNQDWREATEEEALERTRQRFRDRRKPKAERNEAKRKRGRPPKSSATTVTTVVEAVARRPTRRVSNDLSPSPTQERKLNNAIEACLEALENVQGLDNSYSSHANKRVKLFETTIGNPNFFLPVLGMQFLQVQDTMQQGNMMSNGIHAKIKQQASTKLAEALQLLNLFRGLTNYERLPRISSDDDNYTNEDENDSSSTDNDSLEFV